VTASPRLRGATVGDADAMAALHADRIAEGFLVTLGHPFLERLYRRIVRSSRAFALVADVPDSAPRVVGFVAVAEDTRRLYREFLLHDGFGAAVAAARGIVRAPRAVAETLRYGFRADGAAGGAEILATAVARDRGGHGIGTDLVRAAVDELRRRGIPSAHVVTAVGNAAAVHTYERGGFRAGGHREVHRGVAQQLLVWP
jgi:ribosomal protein S18 acetylase RimI-like enzyme